MNKIYQGALALSLAAGIWGGMYVATKYALTTIPPFTLAFLRYTLAGLVLYFICRMKKVPLWSLEEKGLLFQIGFIGYFLSIAAQFIGTKLTSAHMGAVITTLSPVFQSIFALILLKEKTSFKQVVSMLVAFVGVLVIIGLSGLDQTNSSLLGQLLLLAAAFFWGYYSVLSKKASIHYSSLQITTWGVITAAVMNLPFTFWEANLWSLGDLWQGPVLFSVFYIAILSTAVAFFLWNHGIALISSHQAALFFFLQPVVGSLLGWVVLNEQLTWSFYLGTFLIIGGVYYNMIGGKRE